jgi:hypothetical protein
VGDANHPPRGLVATCWVLIAAGVVMMSLQVVGPFTEGCIPNPNLHLASSAADALDAIKYTDPPCPGTDDPPGPDRRTAMVMPPADRLEAFVDKERGAIEDSWWFTIGVTLFLLGVFGWGWYRLYGAGRRRLCGWCAAGTVALFMFDAMENLMVLAGLATLEAGDHPVALDLAAGAGSDWPFVLGSVFAVVKYALTVPLVTLGVVVLATLVGRGLALRAPELRPGGDPVTPTDAPDVIASGPGRARIPSSDTFRPGVVVVMSARSLQEQHQGSAGPAVSDRQRWRDAAPLLPGRTRGELGICASGGGIRSATVTLGALQGLRTERLADSPRSVLSRADYLVSVSGGGYMTGAF